MTKDVKSVHLDGFIEIKAVIYLLEAQPLII